MESQPEQLNELHSSRASSGKAHPLVNAKPKADVVIVSAYGRGNWLAVELTERGWQVTLVDVSENLEPSEPEDMEGPFGWFESKDLLSSQMPNSTPTAIDDGGDLERAENGFVVWPKDGPIEFCGPLFLCNLQN